VATTYICHRVKLTYLEGVSQRVRRDWDQIGPLAEARWQATDLLAPAIPFLVESPCKIQSVSSAKLDVADSASGLSVSWSDRIGMDQSELNGKQSHYRPNPIVPGTYQAEILFQRPIDLECFSGLL
jgi:hypothetical protein